MEHLLKLAVSLEVRGGHRIVLAFGVDLEKPITGMAFEYNSGRKRGLAGGAKFARKFATQMVPMT